MIRGPHLDTGGRGGFPKEVTINAQRLVWLEEGSQVESCRSWGYRISRAKSVNCQRAGE